MHPVVHIILAILVAWIGCILSIKLLPHDVIYIGEVLSVVCAFLWGAYGFRLRG